MSIVSEIASMIKELGQLVKNTREIVDAVNDGRKFLASKYPESKQDFSDLIGQMEITMTGLSKVTNVVSGFRFVIAEGKDFHVIAAQELARFNDYIVKQNNEIDELKKNISKLTGNCKKVRDLRDKLDQRTKTRSWGSMFGLLGAKAQKRSIELHGSLSNFYADDQQMIYIVREMLKLAKKGIKDVEKVLGPPGMADPYQVPVAAETLGIYAVLFEKPQKELKKLAEDLRDAQSKLIV